MCGSAGSFRLTLDEPYPEVTAARVRSDDRVVADPGAARRRDREPQHVDGIGAEHRAFDRARFENTTHRVAVPPTQIEVRRAERNHATAPVTYDDVAARRRTPALPEAQLADQRDSLRVAEFSAPPVLVLGDASPQGYGSEN